MMRRLVIVGLLGLLSACGADGEPVTPTMNGHVGISTDGLFGSARVGLNNGPISVTVGTGRDCLNC